MLAKQFVNSSKLLEQRLAFVLMFYVTDVWPRPARAQPNGYYSRLFRPSAEPLTTSDEGKLIELGSAMRYEVEREGTLTPRVGYTYFAQFVGHDLTQDATPLNGPYVDPELTPNYRSPYLDLEHIYGGGPKASPHLYEGEPETEVFKLGTTTPNRYLRDLPIENGNILIGDARNLVNLILRQLHVVFLKFHNEAIKQLSAKPSTIIGIDDLGSETVFERAQRLVRWHYQWIVRHDFLPRILHHTVWYKRNRTIQILRPFNGDFPIPLEFSLAAYRFGHSMVRRAYGLNCRQKRVELAELMALGHQPSQIPDDFIIEWGHFFDGLPTSGPVASSSYLDTAIALPLHGLGPPIVQLCNRLERSAEPSSLPVRTLLRGARAQLPSGQEVADTLIGEEIIGSGDRLTSSELTRDTCDRSGSALHDGNLEHNTPLFYYLLKEAELRGLGRTLGPLATYIVFNVIEGVLRADPESYVTVFGPHWELPLWRFPSGRQARVNSLIAIIRLVGDDWLLPDCARKWRRLLPSYNSAVSYSHSFKYREDALDDHFGR
jgi:hypothetical protein